MKTFKISTGKEVLKFQIPQNFSYEILEPNKVTPLRNLKEATKESLMNPIASPKLRELAKPGQKISIIICDNTRYVPVKVIIPEVINELINAGVSKKDITIIIATGTHRPMTKKEIVEMLSREIVDTIKVINHDAYDKENLIFLGKSKKLSIPITLNKTVVESDIRIGIGVVEPHLFAGYSGGVKILSVGVAGRQTIAETHNAKILEHPQTKLGDIRNNIFREFLNEVATLVKLDFIVNVIQDEVKRPVKIFAGNSIIAYEEAVKAAKNIYEVKASKKADVVITVPKYPKTINLYQATRAANSVIFGEEPLVRKGGIVIIPARCEDGIGGDKFYNDLASVSDPYEVIQRGRVEGFPPEGHKPFNIARMMQHCKLIITDTDIEKEKIEAMHFSYEESISSALKKVSMNNSSLHVMILPDGCITIPRFNI